MELKEMLRNSAHWVCPDDKDIVQLNVNKTAESILAECNGEWGEFWNQIDAISGVKFDRLKNKLMNHYCLMRKR